jgi:hypothetical protein
MTSQLPFVWPNPTSSTSARASTVPSPYEAALKTARSIFGIVSAIDSQAVDWIESMVADNAVLQLRTVISVHPTCRTTGEDLHNLLRIMDRHADRVVFRVSAEDSLRDRSSNLLCVHGNDGVTVLAVGPTENFGFVSGITSHCNLMSVAQPMVIEACRQWFDFLWASCAPLDDEAASSLPRLVIPNGDPEAARLWAKFRESCLATNTRGESPVRWELDPENGQPVLLSSTGEAIESVTGEIGIPSLNPFHREIARLYELGSLVTVDKVTRIPPLQAPIKPEWFGVERFQQSGTVTAHTTFRISPFDATTMRRLDRLLKATGELLPQYTFALASGIRWMPHSAKPLFAAALERANEEARHAVGISVGSDIAAFLESQKSRIVEDAQSMYENFHPGKMIPENSVNRIIAELHARLGRTMEHSLVPQVAYSPVGFDPAPDGDLSPLWGQVYSLLKGIAEYPRRLMIQRSSRSGVRADGERALIEAMDIAGDYLLKDYGNRNAAKLAQRDLDLLGDMETLPFTPHERCQVVWMLIRTGDQPRVHDLVRSMLDQQ